MAQDISISQMDDFFLYLPVHYAQSRGWFGQLPNNYKVRCRTAGTATDAGALDELMRESGRHQGVGFAICDPIQFLHRDPAEEVFPIALASLVTNAAFWVIDRDAKGIDDIESVASAFSKIVAFHPQTTSYAIAERACMEAQVATTSRVVSVDPSQELIKLKEAGMENAVALCPDPLRIEGFVGLAPAVGTDRFRVHLMVGDRHQFSSMLVSTLVTRSDWLRDSEFEQVARGVLQAIQLSMRDIRNPRRRSDLIQFVNDFYRDSWTREQAAAALQRAIDAQVFPASLHINKGEWLKAARAFAPLGEEREWEQRAGRVYERSIEPGIKYARDAENVKDARSPIQTVGRQRVQVPIAYALAIAATAFAAGLATQFLPWLAVVIGSAIAAWGFAVQIAHRESLAVLEGVAHWALLLVAIFFVVAEGAGLLGSVAGWSMVATVPTVITLVGGDFAFLNLKKRRKDRDEPSS